jgi:hypothetical protein
MIQFYKPNPKNTGTACSFRVSPKDDCVFVNLIKQSSWDETKKRGSFSGNSQNPKMSASLKLNSMEMGEIISAIRRNSEFSGFHDSSKQITKIRFSPYKRASKENPEEVTQVGFSLSISKESKENAQEKTQFLIGFTFGESVKLESYFCFALAKIFEMSALEQNNRQAANSSAPPQAKKPEAAKKSEAEEDDLW